ncbi:unnamed protein product [Sphagnum jensenii]|uniref:SKP1-like protein n=1 Tax=Sphagnum jensenii TaxID=128206 RepID=A0ABP1BJ50_9BRYO
MAERRVKLKSSDDEMFEKASDDKPATREDEIKAWDLDFVKVDQATLFELISAEVLESSSGTVLSDLLLQRRRSVSIVPGLDKLYAAPWRCAANYLRIKNLVDLTCQTVADMIKGKTPEELKKTFNIKNDFTPEEEEEVRRENPWAFE